MLEWTHPLDLLVALFVRPLPLCLSPTHRSLRHPLSVATFIGSAWSAMKATQRKTGAPAHPHSSQIPPIASQPNQEALGASPLFLAFPTCMVFCTHIFRLESHIKYTFGGANEAFPCPCVRSSHLATTERSKDFFFGCRGNR